MYSWQPISHLWARKQKLWFTSCFSFTVQSCACAHTSTHTHSLSLWYIQKYIQETTVQLKLIQSKTKWCNTITWWTVYHTWLLLFQPFVTASVQFSITAITLVISSSDFFIIHCLISSFHITVQEGDTLNSFQISTGPKEIIHKFIPFCMKVGHDTEFLCMCFYKSHLSGIASVFNNYNSFNLPLLCYTKLTGVYKHKISDGIIPQFLATYNSYAIQSKNLGLGFSLPSRTPTATTTIIILIFMLTYCCIIRH
jgi:hypothetical protein